MSGGVRISGGVLRGRRLRVAPGVRPTSARTREALFSIWGDELAAGPFLDLFVGSGAVALEAAGRGAPEVIGIDASERALKLVRSELHALALELAAAVELRRAVLPAGLAKVIGENRRFHLIFADPPYDFAAVGELLESASRHLDREGELALESSARTLPPDSTKTLELSDRRTYGESALSFYRVRR